MPEQPEQPGQEAPSPLRRPEFRRLLAISITVALGFGMVIPVFPLYAKSFGVSLAAIGLVQVVFGLTRFSFALTGGLVVDRYGERFTTMLGLLIVALSSYAAGFSTTFLQFVLARGFGGAGSAFFINGLQSRILKIIEPGAMGRATGAFRSSFLIGIAVGPALGGILGQHFGLAAPFIVYATGLLVATAIAYRVMGTRPEPEAAAALEVGAPRRTPLKALKAASPLFRDFRYVMALLATFVGWWTVSGPMQVMGAVYMEDILKFSESKIGLVITMLSVGEGLVLYFAGRAADKFGRRFVLVPALMVGAAATLLFGQVSAMAWLIFPLAAMVGASVAAGSTAAGGLLADSIPAGGSGAAVGVNQMAGDLGYLLAPITLLSIAQASSYPTAYVIAAIPAAVVLLFALRLPPRSGAIAERVVPDAPDTGDADVNLVG